MNNVKTVSKLIEEALNEVKTISPNEALELSKNDKCNLIDIRDSNELQKTGKIENSLNVSRGLLEFALNPEGDYIKRYLPIFKKYDKKICHTPNVSDLNLNYPKPIIDHKYARTRALKTLSKSKEN